jgi:uncharacterized protein YndB with AHSA1/START domain
MIKTIAMIVAALLVIGITGVLALAATKPDVFLVQRSTTIKAPADRIFPLINDLRAFNTWNPFDRKDPNIKGTYSGPGSGNGATYAFESTKAGSGSIEIVDAAPSSRITMRLIMIKPIAANNRVDFTLQPQGGDTTRVTWAMEGQVPFVGKVLHLIFDMDKMVGKDFEAGLASLKAITENPSSPTG